MGSNKTVYTLDLDTSKLISKYKDAISQMEKAGVSTDLTKGLSKSLQKLEDEYKRLEGVGKAGFTNSKQINNFQRNVEKLMASFRGFENQLDTVNDDIGAIGKSAEQASKRLSKAFSKLGFGDAEKHTQALIQATDREAKLGEIVNNELRKRAALVDELREKYQRAAQAAQAAQGGAISEGLSTNVSAKIQGADGKNRNIWTTGGNKADDATRAAIVQQANEIVKAAQTGQEAWQKFHDYLTSHGLDKAFNQKAMGDIQTRIQAMQQEYQSAAPAIEAAEAAQRQLSEATASFEQIGKRNKDGTVEPLREAYRDLASQVNGVNRVEERSANVLSTATADSARLAQTQREVADATQSVAGAAASEEGRITSLTSNIKETATASEKASSAFEQLKNRLLMFFSVTSMFNTLKKQIRDTYNDVKKLDKAFASIAMVTSNSVKGMWSSYSQYADMAANLGQKTEDVIKASALFYQQGLDTTEALELTTDTMKLATLAGNDFETATQEMTSALRGFKMEMDEGAHVTDVYSTLAAHAAASVDDIAQAMARTASIANSAGMSFENTSSFLTQMIETTQESAENIGTSLKTIIARFTELKNNVAGTADSEFDDLDFNKVDTALKSVGVSLKDTTGQFRNLDQVFLELSKKWDTLDRNTQRYVATIAAGSRQQSRFIAMMDNYDRTVELMDLAANAEGKADEQFAKYADTMEYKLNQLSTTWEEFRVKIMNADMFKNVVDGINEVVKRINGINLSNKFDLSRLLISAPIVIKMVKSLSLNMVKSFQSVTKSMKTIGTNLGNVLTQSFRAKLGGFAGPQTLQVLRNQINQLKDELYGGPGGSDIFSDKEIRVYYDFLNKNNSYEKATQEYDTLRQKLEQAGMGAEEAAQKARTFILSLNPENFDQLQTKINGLNQALEDYNIRQAQVANKQKLWRAAMQTAGIVAQSLTTSLLAVANGTMSFSEALNTAKNMIIVLVAQLAIQKAATVGAAIATEYYNLKIVEGTERITMDTIAKAANVSVTTAWVAIMLLAAAAIAAVALVIGGLYNAYMKQKKAEQDSASATQQLSKEHERLSEAYTKAKENADNAKNAMEDAKSATEKMTEAEEKYVDQKYLTDEEAEEWLALQKEIADQMPELLDYYDSEGNAIVKLGDAWDKALESKREYYKDQYGLYAEENLRAATLNLQDLNAELERYTKYKNIEDNPIISVFMQGLADAAVADYKYGRGGISNEGIDYTAYLDTYEYNGKEYYQVAEDVRSATSILRALADNAFWQSNTGDYKVLAEALSDAGLNPADIGNYIKDALTTAGSADKFNVSDKSGSQVFDEIIKVLDDDKENEQLRYLTDALKDFPAEVARQIAASKRGIQEAENVLDKAVDISIEAATEQSDIYTKATSDNVRSIMNEFVRQQRGLTLEELTNDFDNNHGGNNFKENGEVIPERLGDYNRAFSDYLNQQFEDLDAESLDDLLSVFNPTNQAAIDNFFAAVQDGALGSADALDLLEQQLELGIFSNDGIFQALLGRYSDVIEGREERAESLRKFFGAKGIETDEFGNIKSSDINKDITDYYEQLGDESQKAFLDGLKKGGKSPQKTTEALVSGLSGASDTVKDYLAGLDWESVSGLTEKGFKQGIISTLIDEYKLAEDEAEKFYSAQEQFEKDVEVINLDFVNTAQLAGWQGQVEDITKAIEKNDDILQKFAKNNKERIKLTQEEYNKLDEARKALINAGVSKELLGKALGYDEATNSWILNGKLWNDTLKDATINTTSLIDRQIELNKQKRDAVGTTQTEKNEIDAANKKLEEMKGIFGELALEAASAAGWISSIADTINSFSNLSSVFGSVGKSQKDNGFLGVKDISSLTEAFEQIGDSTFDVSRFVNDQLQLNIDALYDYINAQITEIETSGELVDASSEELMMWKAMKKELIATRNEVDAAASALEDKAKSAMEAYEKQVETVAEKQESLNDKLKNYHDLLYGTENRKSGLDLLYNYEEAINSLNDEMTRTKELLGDSKTVEEAYDNLKRYTAATHEYLAEEKARQAVIEQGLANYGNMIENGSASYTDSESGRTISVNFGAYARKDQRTGKYILDQRLLEQAQFGDKYKDLIEQQISTYNSYVDKYKKSQDDILKIEKELQKQREDAVKNYAAMEKSIADALKQQYQDEVDQLKDKYESMKDADDDYLDALKDAIDKQRKLRDQEKARDDLAQKEKKLSLMRRDTSGANAVETRKLEKEIQDDREQMLDDAIDNIIDGLEELYESQQELKDAELELKDALLDNTLYWNMQAQDLAASFTNADDYARYLSSISKEYAESTLAMQEEKLNQYGEEFSQASQYLAITAMDTASETGDFVVDTMTVTGDEICNIVAETSETFTTEVTRAYNETTDAFITDLQKAEEEIAKARAELQEAIAKLDELARKANEAAAALANANTEVGVDNSHPSSAEVQGETWATGGTKPSNSNRTLVDVLINNGLESEAIDDITHKYEGDEAARRMMNAMFNGKDTITMKGLTNEAITRMKEVGYFVGSYDDSFKVFKKERDLDDWIRANAIGGHVKRYLNGGLVDQTGLAYVDGTTEKPEAFLNAEDTENIGNAAKILADIPWMDRDTDSAQVVTNNGGDVSIEVNLNIDHISSDVDIDEMLEKIKEEIVEVAHPAGTNVILNQQLG